MTTTTLSSLEAVLTMKRQWLAMTRSPRSRIVLKQDIQRLRHRIEKMKARPL